MFTNRAKWIWDQPEPREQHSYVEARRVFSLKPAELRRLADGESELTITADAAYQVWLNERLLGHGPAKSAQGRRSVDTYDLAGLLRSGPNELHVLALRLGVGTMRYCLGEAGVRFELALGDRRIGSDARTEVRPAPDRHRRTARRWILPCLEDVDVWAHTSDPPV